MPRVRSTDGKPGPAVRPMRLNDFEMAMPGHMQPGPWTYPRDRSADFAQLTCWTDLARLLERGLSDGLFPADVLGICDVYGGSPEAVYALWEGGWAQGAVLRDEAAGVSIGPAKVRPIDHRGATTRSAPPSRTADIIQ